MLDTWRPTARSAGSNRRVMRWKFSAYRPISQPKRPSLGICVLRAAIWCMDRSYTLASCAGRIEDSGTSAYVKELAGASHLAHGESARARNAIEFLHARPSRMSPLHAGRAVHFSPAPSIHDPLQAQGRHHLARDFLDGDMGGAEHRDALGAEQLLGCDDL